MPNESETSENRVLASDVVKYLRLRAEAENFRKSHPQLDRTLARLLNENNTALELGRLHWDIPSL